MITYHGYTTETRLDNRLGINKDVLTYLDQYVTTYSEMTRYLWYHLQDPAFHATYKSRSQINTHLCQRYNLLKRTANNLLADVNGRISALKALKKYELKELRQKIHALTKRRKKLVKQLKVLKKKVAKNNASEAELIQYRKLKRAVFYLNRKYNQKWMQLVARTAALGKRLKMGFGTKTFFKAQHHLSENKLRSHTDWHNRFIRNRDKTIFYMGSQDETCGNQMLQLAESPEGFIFKLRKENNFCQEKTDKYVTGICDFRYLQKELSLMLDMGNLPMTYRFKRRGRIWYLQVVVAVPGRAPQTTTRNGILGLDYNEDFVAMSETDGSGNLIGLSHFDLAGSSGAARNEALCVMAKRICQQAVATGKTVVIEDLDFHVTKAKTLPARGKAGKIYNKMLHQLDYSRYKVRMQDTGFKLGVDIVMVDPANTSKIAKQKFCPRKKLTTHQGASYVIARRGQGFFDTLVS